MPASTIPLTLTPDSSQLHGYGYDAATQTMAVEFKSNHGKYTYHYKGVTPEQAAAMDAAESKGSFVYRNLKGKMDFDRMEKDDAEAEAA